MINISVT